MSDFQKLREDAPVAYAGKPHRVFKFIALDNGQLGAEIFDDPGDAWDERWEPSVQATVPVTELVWL